MRKGEMTKVARELNRIIRLSQPVYYKRLKTESDLVLKRNNIVVMGYLMGILLQRPISPSEVVGNPDYEGSEHEAEIFERAISCSNPKQAKGGAVNTAHTNFQLSRYLACTFKCNTCLDSLSRRIENATTEHLSTRIPTATHSTPNPAGGYRTPAKKCVCGNVRSARAFFDCWYRDRSGVGKLQV